jgi:hypothetical protein
MHRLYTVTLLLLLFFLPANSSIPVGAWRDHFSYRRANNIAVADDVVYCAAGPGLIVFRKKDSSLEKLSKANGLSDVDISRIKWSDENKLLIVGYSNGNLDLIKENRIINLSDILRSSIPGTKSINNIQLVGTNAYLSCSFGVVKVDLERNEIRETYYLGEGGARLVINDIAYDGTYLYAATSAGLYRANINMPNLMDFSQWSRMDILPEPGSLFLSLAWFDGSLYAIQLTGSGDYASIMITGNTWSYFNQASANPVSLEVSDRYLAIIKLTEAEIYTYGHTLVEKIDHYGFASAAIMSIGFENNGNAWIADRRFGLVRRTGGNYTSLVPPGPISNSSFSITSYPGRTHIAVGGYNLAMVPLHIYGEFSTFSQGAWSGLRNYDIRDVVCVMEHPDDPGTQLLATWGYGLAEYRNGILQEIYKEHNSTLQSIYPGQDYLRIGGMTFDSGKNLWLTNFGVANPISVRKANGEWMSFPYKEKIDHDRIGNIIVNRLGQKWVVLPRGGIFVFDADGNGNGGNTRKLNFSNGALISDDVHSIAEDHNGNMWVGLNDGVVVFYNPSRVFTDDDYQSHQIVLPGSREEELGYLLNNETVTSIAVDGANRKWFGTEKSGVFLISADGRQQIYHFTRQNSPLPSNTVNDISIDPASGEVFFGTTSGVVSFRGDAISPHSTFGNVYVFPNPVRENYDGPVTITGLVKDTSVKITDVSGNLVFEITSPGGQAVWDGKNLRGQRVRTGIYLVFLTNPDGSQTHISKIMFIH